MVKEVKKAMQIKRTRNDSIWATLLIIFAICFLVSLFSQNPYTNQTIETNTNVVIDNPSTQIISYTMDTIPEYNEDMEHPYVYIDNNIPDFSDVINTTDLSSPFEIYTMKEDGKRCGVALANVCYDTMPISGETDNKSSRINPTGWPKSTDDITDGEKKIIYHRCHLIAFSLTAEAGNERNLITGTSYMNRAGMWHFEYLVKKHIDNFNGDKSKCHVLYRVTPIFEGENLLASGVHMEAMSVEDSGQSLHFNVFVYNVQKGVQIDYSTGKIVK